MKRLPAEQSFRLVHPCDCGVTAEEYEAWSERYRRGGERCYAVRWDDGLCGFVLWPLNDPVPSQAALGWARFWAEQVSSLYWRSAVMH